MLNIPLLLTYKDKGSKQALSSMNKLEKRAKSLGKSLGFALSTAAVVAFGKASAKAFLADEKAAASLNQTLKLTGNAYASIPVQNFIASLQRQTGVLDDELRPAFQSILTATEDRGPNAMGHSKCDGASCGSESHGCRIIRQR